MDQHPVPQNISSYEFRLVGDMTLKQFFQLAGGGVTALIFYRSPLPFFLKYPFIFISVLGGILLAFVPLNGRPFSQWILAFIKAVYSPTQFFWNPTDNPKNLMLNAKDLSNKDSELSVKPDSPLDKLESQWMEKFSNLFENFTHRSASTPPPLPQNNSFLTTAQLTPTASYSPLTASVAPSQNTVEMGMFLPTQPNILAGVVLDNNEVACEGVILEITERASGLPVRALRTNKLGQFQIATPLPNREYVISAEKEGQLFDPVLIVTSGQVMPPILIKARPLT